MIARVNWGKIKPGKWEAYARLWNDYSKQLSGAAGFRGRMLLRDAENKDAGYSISFWDSAASFEAYSPDPASITAFQDCFVGQYVTTVTEVAGLDVSRLAG